MPGKARAVASDEMLKILCWEGYDAESVLKPFRDQHPGAQTKARTDISDLQMIDQLRRGGIRNWDLINLNQPWAREVLYPEGLIAPLDHERFMPYFDKMLPAFRTPYQLSFADDGSLLGMPQRFGPLSFVVNTDRISRKTAESEGWNLFLEPSMKHRFGVLTYETLNIIHLCLTAGIDPFKTATQTTLDKFAATANSVFTNAKFFSDDMNVLNRALLSGEIDAYFTGGTYTASAARLAGARNIRGITPTSGPVNGKGGLLWVELTSAVNNPIRSPLAEDFLEYVQDPRVAKAVALVKQTHNPVAQMGNPAVMSEFSSEELDAIQWDSLEEEISRSLDHGIVSSHDKYGRFYQAAIAGRSTK